MLIIGLFRYMKIIHRRSTGCRALAYLRKSSRGTDLVALASCNMWVDTHLEGDREGSEALREEPDEGVDNPKDDGEPCNLETQVSKRCGCGTGV
jgi:hypothetical protein